MQVYAQENGSFNQKWIIRSITMLYNMSAHLNSLTAALGEQAAPGGVLDILQRELNVLHQRIDGLEKQVEILKRGFRDYPDNRNQYFWDSKGTGGSKSSQEEQERIYSLLARNQDVKFVESLFGEPIKDPGNPPGFIKPEEPHPAHSSSFVLKI